MIDSIFGANAFSDPLKLNGRPLDVIYEGKRMTYDEYVKAVAANAAK